jgi:TonB family protein
LRLSLAGEISDEAVAALDEAPPSPVPTRPRRKAPTRPPAETRASASAAAPPPAPTWTPPALDEDFWSAAGTGTHGDGEQDETRDDEAEATFQAAEVVKLDGAGWTDLTVLDDSVELAAETAVSVRRTELGVWYTAVYEGLRSAWRPPLGAKALGYQGRVVVAFEIAASGTILSVAVVYSNASPEMERAALAAVPAEVAPPPAEYAPLKVQHTFRYGDVTSGANSPGAR